MYTYCIWTVAVMRCIQIRIKSHNFLDFHCDVILLRYVYFFSYGGEGHHPITLIYSFIIDCPNKEEGEQYESNDIQTNNHQKKIGWINKDEFKNIPSILLHHYIHTDQIPEFSTDQLQ